MAKGFSKVADKIQELLDLFAKALEERKHTLKTWHESQGP